MFGDDAELHLAYLGHSVSTVYHWTNNISDTVGSWCLSDPWALHSQSDSSSGEFDGFLDKIRQTWKSCGLQLCSLGILWGIHLWWKLQINILFMFTLCDNVLSLNLKLLEHNSVWRRTHTLKLLIREWVYWWWDAAFFKPPTTSCTHSFLVFLWQQCSSETSVFVLKLDSQKKVRPHSAQLCWARIKPAEFRPKVLVNQKG